MRRSDNLLISQLDEIHDFLDAGGMADMTEEEKDALGSEIRDIVAELLDRVCGDRKGQETRRGI